MTSPPHIVLVGAGHTHVEFLRRWPKRPIAEARLTCVSEFSHSSYSGMVPGVLAGQYEPQAMTINSARLANSVGCRFLVGHMESVDLDRRRLILRSGESLEYDYLSLGIGSTVAIPSGDGNRVVPVKPMPTFLQRCDQALADAAAHRGGQPCRITVVGGGPAGVELALALGKRHVDNGKSAEISLLEAGDRILDGIPARARKLAERHLTRVNITVTLQARIASVDNRNLQFQDGRTHAADVIIWAAGAAAPAELANINAEHDEAGFLTVDQNLRLIRRDREFAVGDTASLVSQNVPKAGVYAVRAAPILWRNLWNTVQHRPLTDWRPQREFLRLLNTADGRAILVWHGWSCHQAWAWWLKDRIDRAFVGKYQA